MDAEKVFKICDVLKNHKEGIWLSKLADESGISRQLLNYYLKKNTQLASIIKISKEYRSKNKTVLKIVKLR